MTSLLVGSLAFLATLLGGIFAIRFKDRLHLILGFSAGAVLGVALFDLIPESITLATLTHPITLVMVLMAAGFVAYLLIDRLFSLHQSEDCIDCEKPYHRGFPAAITLVFHSFLDGVGIGLAFKVSPAVGAIVTAAVLAHDFSDGINTVNMIFRRGQRQKAAVRWLIADALAPMLGIIATFFIVISEPSLGLILAVFAGFFLYLGASDLVPESHHRHPSFWTSIATILGIAVLFLATYFAG